MMKQKTDKTQAMGMQEIRFLAMVSLFWFAQYVYIPYQTIYLTGIGVTSRMVGVIVGAYGVSQLLFRLPVGICADRIGRHKPFIIAGALASGLASLFRVFWCNETGFLTANLLSGLASAMWISFMVFYITGFSRGNQQKATSKIVMFNNLGMLLGFVASTLCYSRIGMKQVCLLSVAAGLGAFVLAWMIQEVEFCKGSLSIRQLVQVCKGKRILVFSLVALIQQGIQLTTTMSFTNQILKDSGASTRMIGVSSIVYMMGAVLFAGLASSKFCERKGPRFWIPAVLVALAVYCVLVPVAGSVPVIIGLQLLPGMATGILFSYATSEAMKGVPVEQKSTAMGFFQAVYAVGMTVFPVVTGRIVANVSMQAGYLALAVVVVAGCVGVSLYYFGASK